jgi:hypothetical protein
MNKKLIILLIVIFCLPLFACSGSGSPEAVAPAESTEIDQPQAAAQPTSAPQTSSSEKTIVNNIDQITGTWIAAADLGNFVAVISPDGMFRVATSSEELEKGSTDSWKLNFENDQITATGYALCLGDTGYYLAEIKADGTLKFVTISDPCTGRIRKMDRSIPGRLTPYDLIFHPVK